MALANTRLDPPLDAGISLRRGRRSPWAMLAAVITVALTVPPLLIAAAQTPVESTFSGYVVIARDAYVYQAIWREGFAGAWLFHAPYTTESLPGVLLYPWYLWPGHVLGAVAGPWLYHGLRLAAAIALLSALWSLIGELFRPRLLRRWAFILCVLGGGIGVFVPSGVRLGPLVSQPTEMRSPGSSVADLIAMAPHLPWAMALMCWIMVVALRSRRPGKPGELISGAGAIIGLQLIYPQLALLAVVVIAAWAILTRRTRPAVYALVAGAIQIPYDVYLFSLGRQTPQALAVIRSSLDVGDLFGFIVLSHLVATALIVVAVWRRRLGGDRLLPALWIAGITAFMFLPGLSGVLSRSFMASSIPFGLCATPGLLSLLRKISGRAWRRRLLAVGLAGSSLYGLFSLAQPYWIAAFRLDARAEYEPAGEAALLGWLAPRVGPGDAVLTSYLDGIFVPAQTDARTYVGHPDMTIDAARKSSQANAFFTSWTPAQRQAFLLRNHLDYVLTHDPATINRLDQDSVLKRVADSDGAVLYTLR